MDVDAAWAEAYEKLLETAHRYEMKLAAQSVVIDVARLVVEHQEAGPAGPGWEARRDELWKSLTRSLDQCSPEVKS